MVSSLKPDQSIGIIDPSCLSHKMIMLAHFSDLYKFFFFVNRTLCFVYISNIISLDINCSLSRAAVLKKLFLQQPLKIELPCFYCHKLCLTFYCPCSHSLYNISLCRKGNDHDRKAKQKCTCTHRSKIQIISRQKSCQTYGKRLCIRTC